MVGVEIRYCTDVEAFYVTIGGGKIVRTAHISDDVIAPWTRSSLGRTSSSPKGRTAWGCKSLISSWPATSGRSP
jgi:hypothetical protein